MHDEKPDWLSRLLFWLPDDPALWDRLIVWTAAIAAAVVIVVEIQQRGGL